MMNTIITINVADEAIPVEIIAKLRGMTETALQKEKRKEKE